MPTHDPSTCELCGWLGEREGWEYKRPFEHWLKMWVNDKLARMQSIMPSFCPSLDAVVGLIRELGEKGLGCLGYYNGSWCWFWPEEWPGPEPEPEWWWKGMHGPEPIESEDYSCVIEAAMAVLGDKEDGA